MVAVPFVTLSTFSAESTQLGTNLARDWRSLIPERRSKIGAGGGGHRGDVGANSSA